MKKLPVLFCFLLIPFLGYSQKHKKNVPVDSASFMSVHPAGGTSIADAVIILENKSETKVIEEINTWLKFKYPGNTYVSTINVQNTSDKIYDGFKIKTSDGTVIDVYFDVSAFYIPQQNKSR